MVVEHSLTAMSNSMSAYFRSVDYSFKPDFSISPLYYNVDGVSKSSSSPWKTASNSQQIMGSVVATLVRNSDSTPMTPFRFLDLPVEIRLQIYAYLRPIHHAKHAHLSPSTTYPPPTSSAFFLAAISMPIEFPGFGPSGKEHPSNEANHIFQCGASKALPLTRGGQGCGYMPRALLTSCKQVHRECREIPWQQNEYVFINWFCSGVYAARSFLKALKPWQREQMRYARLEVLGRDLRDSWVATMVGGVAGGGEWMDLCRLWSGGDYGAGLRGLRLGIKGRLNIASTSPTSPAISLDIRQSDHSLSIMAEIDGITTMVQPHIGAIPPKDRAVLDVEAEWIASGISQMKSLQWLELEIEDDEIPREIKVQFCISLGRKLGIEVSYSERIEHKHEPETDAEFTGAASTGAAIVSSSHDSYAFVA